MATAGACHAKKSAQVFGVARWKSNEDWMARTGYASAAAISGCAIAQHPGDRPQVLPAYGLQDLRNEHQDPKTKSNPNTMCLQITLGENHGSGHFYLAKTRTFLLCVDTTRRETTCNPSGTVGHLRSLISCQRCTRRPCSIGR